MNKTGELQLVFARVHDLSLAITNLRTNKSARDSQVVKSVNVTVVVWEQHI